MGQNDSAEDGVKPAIHSAVFSPLEAIQVHETRYIRQISAYFQPGKTGYNLIHFVGILVEVQAIFLSCNEPLVLKMNGKERGETRDTLPVI